MTSLNYVSVVVYKRAIVASGTTFADDMVHQDVCESFVCTGSRQRRTFDFRGALQKSTEKTHISYKQREE